MQNHYKYMAILYFSLFGKIVQWWFYLEWTKYEIESLNQTIKTAFHDLKEPDSKLICGSHTLNWHSCKIINVLVVHVFKPQDNKLRANRKSHFYFALIHYRYLNADFICLFSLSTRSLVLIKIIPRCGGSSSCIHVWVRDGVVWRRWQWRVYQGGVFSSVPAWCTAPIDEGYPVAFPARRST